MQQLTEASALPPKKVLTDSEGPYRLLYQQVHAHSNEQFEHGIVAVVVQKVANDLLLEDGPDGAQTIDQTRG